VFRGSDVKDLRIEKEPEEKPAPQPQVPDDPAILGVSAFHKQLLWLCWLSHAYKERVFYVMKNFGCKSYIVSPRAQNRVEIFRCLPSDIYIPSPCHNRMHYGGMQLCTNVC